MQGVKTLTSITFGSLEVTPAHESGRPDVRMYCCCTAASSTTSLTHLHHDRQDDKQLDQLSQKEPAAAYSCMKIVQAAVMPLYFYYNYNHNYNYNWLHTS
jgi:hypothetical protein